MIQRRRNLVWLVLGSLLLLQGACRSSEGAPTLSISATPAPSPSATPSPTATPVPSPTPTPTLTPTPTVTPRELLETAAVTMGRQDSFHFRLEYEGERGMPLVEGLELVFAEGDVAGPDLQVTFGVRLGEISAYIENRAIRAGGVTYLSDPFTGQWSEVAASQAPCTFSELGQRVARIAGLAENVSLVGLESLDGRPAHHLRASLLAEDLASTFCTVSSGEEVAADIWLGQEEGLILRVRMEGRIGAGEVEGLVRTLSLSRFGEPVSIEAPGP